MQKVRHELDETEQRIAAVLLASPRASWRTVARVLGVSERTVVRRAVPLVHDGTIRTTAVRNPARFPDLIPIALRIRCRPDRISTVAHSLARRPDSVWVEILGGGDEICAVLFLTDPGARNTLLLRDLPSSSAVQSWDSYDLLRVFPAGFAWSAGLLSAEELENLGPGQLALSAATEPLAPQAADGALIDALIADGRATFSELGQRSGISAVTARRRLDVLQRNQMFRLACEVDMALLGVRTEALLWITTTPGGIEATGQAIADHPQVRFASATTGSANLLAAVSAADLGALYAFLTGTLGGLPQITGVEVMPILAAVKRTGLIRRSTI